MLFIPITYMRPKATIYILKPAARHLNETDLV